jgi:hypothetical protein
MKRKFFLFPLALKQIACYFMGFAFLDGETLSIKCLAVVNTNSLPGQGGSKSFTCASIHSFIRIG